LKRTNEAESLNWKTNMHQECSSYNVKHNVKYTLQCYRYTFSRYWIILHFTIWEQITVPSCNIVGQTLEINQELWIQQRKKINPQVEVKIEGHTVFQALMDFFGAHMCSWKL
jgi:hypothetical protein